MRAPVAAHDVVHDVGDLVGQHPAVGVAQGDHLGTGLGGDPHGLEGVVAVRGVAVEEVLGVEEDPATLGAQERDGVADHLEVLLEGRAQGPLDVAGVRLRDEGDDLGLAVEQRPHEGVALGAAPGPAGRPERRERRVAQGQLARRTGEELGVLGVRTGPATLDVPDAQLVEVRGDGELVRHGEVEPLLLGAVAQRRVVDVEVGHRCSPGVGLPVTRRRVPRPVRAGAMTCGAPSIVGPALLSRCPGWGRCDPAPRSRRARDAPDKQKTPRVREVCATRSSRRASR